MTMPQGFAGAQPMQMFMVAPMAAPAMTSMPGLDEFSCRSEGGYAANMGAEPSQWAVEGLWSHFGSHHVSQEAPRQWPMQLAIPEAGPTAACAEWNSKTEVPSQIDMDIMPVVHAGMQLTAAVGACTLRQRRRGGSTQTPHQEVECAADVETHDVNAGADADAEVEDIQVNEIIIGLLRELQDGDAARQSAVTNFKKLAFSSKTTSRAAQMALKEAPATDAAALAASLRGHVWEAMQSKHANYVLQKITEVMPAVHASFIVDELKGFGHEAARHCFGCRVLCRILEHLSPHDSSTLDLTDEILLDLSDLCKHEFGSFVVRHVLEFGLPLHKHRVAMALSVETFEFSKHKFASHVVESALRHCSQEDQRTLARQLLGNQQQLLVVAGNQFGRHVIRAALQMPCDLQRESVEALTPIEHKLKAMRYGKSVLQALRIASKSCTGRQA
jgi:pumilio RNA-binding family